MQQVDGLPLIRRQALACCATGLPVFVTLPCDRPDRNTALTGLDLTQVPVPDAASGLSASMHAGIAAVGPRPVLVLLADLPDITTADLLQLLARHPDNPDRILRATAEDGTPGHPVLFPLWALPELAAMTGDSGARDFLKREAGRTDLIALPARHAITDLDTPEDWAAWSASRSGS